MSRHTSALLSAAACALLACGGSTRQAPPPTGELAPLPEGGPSEAAPAGPVIVTRLSGSDSAPATDGSERTVATARVEGDAVILSLADFIYYCEPPPTFGAHLEGDLVIVQAEPPSEPPTRCIGPHSAQLRLDDIPAGVHTVSVRNQADEEVATATVSR